MDFLIMQSLRGSSCLLLLNKLIMDLDDYPLLLVPNILSKVLSSYSGLQKGGKTNSSKVLISMCNYLSVVITPPYLPPTIKPQSYITFA